MRMRCLWLCMLATVSLAQQSGNTDSTRVYVSQHQQAILQEFEEFLAIPNLASNDTRASRIRSRAAAGLFTARSPDTRSRPSPAADRPSANK